MNTNFYLYILWGVSSVGLLCAGDAHESPNRRTKTVFKPDAPKPRPKKSPITGYSSIYRAPSDRSSEFHQRAKGPDFSPGALTPPDRSPEETRARFQSEFAYVPDVSVTCSATVVVLRVKPAFYGLGADADELTLGSTCRSTGVLRPYGDLLFTYPLTACDAVRHQVRFFFHTFCFHRSVTTCFKKNICSRQSSRDYLTYKYVLRYEPSPKRLTSRAHPMEVDIECRYPR